MEYGQHVQGNTTLAAVGNSDIIAAVAGKRLHVTSITVTISVTAASAVVSIDDGTTTYWAWAAATAGQNYHFHMNFGEKGFLWSSAVNKALRLVVSGGNATVHATAMGYFRGHA